MYTGPLKNKKINVEIIKCSWCEGRGYTTTHEVTDYHKSEYDVKYHTCTSCKGTGLLKKTEEISTIVEPYNPKEYLENMPK